MFLSLNKKFGLSTYCFYATKCSNPIQASFWFTVSFSLFSPKMYAFQSCFSKQSYRKAKSIRWSAKRCHMATLQSFFSKQSYLKAKSFIWSANSCHMATLQSFFSKQSYPKANQIDRFFLVLTNVNHVYPKKRLQSVIIVLNTLPLRYLLVLQCIHLNVWNCILLRWSADHQCTMPQYLSPNGNLCIQLVHFVHPRPPPPLLWANRSNSGPSKVSDSSVGYFHSLQHLQLESILNQKGMRVLP